jgi:hypothetical protein
LFVYYNTKYWSFQRLATMLLFYHNFSGSEGFELDEKLADVESLLVYRPGDGGRWTQRWEPANWGFWEQERR